MGFTSGTETPMDYSPPRPSSAVTDGLTRRCSSPPIDLPPLEDVTAMLRQVMLGATPARLTVGRKRARSDGGIAVDIIDEATAKSRSRAWTFGALIKTDGEKRRCDGSPTAATLVRAPAPSKSMVVPEKSWPKPSAAGVDEWIVQSMLAGSWR